MQDDLQLQAYDYHLPEKNIAQHPAEKRDQSKLLVYSKKSRTIDHQHFSDITGYFAPGDVLVLNDTRVFPARLLGQKETGGKVEVFLLGYPRYVDTGNDGSETHFSAEALIKSSRSPKPGARIRIGTDCSCTLVQKSGRGKWSVVLAIPSGLTLDEILSKSGEVPLPPYINRTKGVSVDDRGRYQTVYAQQAGAVAAPTAGLHFTETLLNDLALRGITIATITLHVGYGTFSPVEAENITNHIIHNEQVTITEESAKKVNRAKEAGGKVWAVGTTTVRSLESCSGNSGVVYPYNGLCDLYITPGYRFTVVDNLITNFHLPKSSLMFLVSAFIGRKELLYCYQEAIKRDYRFFSYGDAMVLIS